MSPRLCRLLIPPSAWTWEIIKCDESWLVVMGVGFHVTWSSSCVRLHMSLCLHTGRYYTCLFHF